MHRGSDLLNARSKSEILRSVDALEIGTLFSKSLVSFVNRRAEKVCFEKNAVKVK